MTRNPVTCDGCGEEQSTKVLQFHKKPYTKTLRTKRVSKTGKNYFEVCENCKLFSSLVTRLMHQKYHFYEHCKSKVEKNMEEKPDLCDEDVLKSILNEREWISGVSLFL